MSPYRVDAQMSGRHPFELFTLYLAVLVSFPLVLGVVPEPGSVEAALPGWLVTLWGVMLLTGSSLAIIGIFLKSRGIGLILEQLGLAGTGVAGLVYSACALFALGLAAAVPAALVAGFALSCLWRCFQIQSIIDQAVTVAKYRGENR